jgi:transposase InsO family protein
MRREGWCVARCTVERLMPTGQSQSPFQGGSARPALGGGLHLRHSERLAEAGIEPSVGSKGDSYDNALAESINGLYKAEVIHRCAWPTRESVELATLEWASWFNHHRLLGPIVYIPPAEAEANYYRRLAIQASTVET